MDESLQRHLEQHQLGKLKLSEAIRIGARMMPQGTGNPRANKEGVCAIGAAWIATGHDLPHDCYFPYSDFCEFFGVTHKLMGSIWCRNDEGDQTREQIADWLEAQGY